MQQIAYYLGLIVNSANKMFLYLGQKHHVHEAHVYARCDLTDLELPTCDQIIQGRC